MDWQYPADTLRQKDRISDTLELENLRLIGFHRFASGRCSDQLMVEGWSPLEGVAMAPPNTKAVADLALRVEQRQLLRFR